MKQYLLSVIHAWDRPMPPEDEMMAAFARVEAFNDELTSRRLGLRRRAARRRTSATVVRPQGGDVLVTDGPFAETKEQLGGFWVIKAEDLDAALAWRRGVAACGETSRCGRSRTSRGLRPRCRGRHATSRPCSARSTAAPSPPWSASSATSTSPRRRSRTPSWPRRALARGGVPPNPGGWIVTTARRRAIDRFRREARATRGTPRRCCCTRATSPRRWDRCRTTGSGCSSPAATRRWRWRRGSR